MLFVENFRAGPGVALRCLSYLEQDVEKNWQPFRPILRFPNNSNLIPTLEVTWCDPPAVLFLFSLASKLKVIISVQEQV